MCQTPELAPRGLLVAAVKALIYGGLRVQEACDLQLRDVDLAGLSITVRYGKAGKARRVPIHSDAQRLLQRYLERVRCPDGLPPVESNAEREPFLRHRRGCARPSAPSWHQPAARAADRLGAGA